MSSNNKVIKDPLHGFIELTSLQEELIEQPELQRLAWVKQLGLTFLVYPGAHQTRLEHSLGTSYLAREVSDSLGLSEMEKKRLEAAGLLHDLGHAPFSHSVESFMEKDHMKITKDMITGESRLDAPGTGEVPRILEEYGLDPEKVSSLVTGEYKGKKYLQDIMNSEMDVDQLDYLIRDAYYTGTTYGKIETERIIGIMKLNQGRVNYLEKGIEPLEDYFLSRDHMYSNVYAHKTVSISEKMLLRATERANIKELYKMRDGELIQALKQSNPYSKEMANRIIYRDLYKQAYTVKSTDPEEEKRKIGELQRKEEETIEKEISKRAEIEQDEVIVNNPNRSIEETDSRLKEFNIGIIKKNGETVPLPEVSKVVKSLSKKQPLKNLFSIYTTEENREKVSDITQEYLKQ